MNNDSLVLSALKKVVPIHLQRVNIFARKKARQNPHTQVTSHEPTMPKTEAKTAYKSAKIELKQAVKGSNEVLVRATTALTFFSDTIVVNRDKVSITRRNFISMSEVVGIPVEDILNVTVTAGPFLATIKIVSRVINLDPIVIGKFWRQDAFKLKKIIQGYAIALQQNIDCNSIPTDELIDTLDRLGADKQ